jgi:hypothetical protein
MNSGRRSSLFPVRRVDVRDRAAVMVKMCVEASVPALLGHIADHDVSLAEIIIGEAGAY